MYLILTSKYDSAIFQLTEKYQLYLSYKGDLLHNVVQFKNFYKANAVFIK